MKLTDEQFNALSPYAEEFRSATEHNFVRNNPGSKTLDALREIYMTVTGVRHYSRNWGCGACVVDLFKDLGFIYLADADERSAAALEAANDKAAVQATIEDADKPADEGEKEPESAAPKPKTAPKSAKTAKAAKSGK